MAGRGGLRGPLFDAKRSALYTVAYTIQLQWRRRGREFPVADLEAFWVAHSPVPLWKLGLRVRPDLTATDVAGAIAALSAKGKDPLVKDVRLEPLPGELHSKAFSPAGTAKGRVFSGGASGHTHRLS